MNEISDRFIDLIKKNFFVEPNYIRTIKALNDWKEISRRIQSREVKSHFQGNYFIGYIIRNSTANFCVFDLDSHSIKTKSTLHYRYDSIINKLGNPHIIASSPNKGLHLYYFLDDFYHLNYIKNIIIQQIKLEQGLIELFPRGTGLRLFGGKDCPILDHNLKPITKTTEDIEEHFIMVWEEAEKINPDIFISSSPSRAKKSAPFRFNREIELLLDGGLKAPSTRNEALCNINFFLQTYEGYNPNEAESFLSNWISTKHNGYSKDWKKNPRGVINQIKCLVKCYDPNKIKKVKHFQVEKLSKQELVNIRQLSSEISYKYGLDIIRTTEFLIDLLAYCKVNMDNGLVEIPKVVFQACNNGSGKRYMAYKEALLKNGALKLKKNYCTTINRCTTYRLKKGLINCS